MKLTLDNYLSLRGIQPLQDAKRALHSDARPSEFVPVQSANTFLSVRGFASSRVSAELSSAITLHTFSQSESSPVKFQPKGSILAPMNLPADPRANPLVNSDEVNRSTRIEGVGDRGSGVTNTTPVETPKLFPLSTTDSLNLNLITDTSALPEDEALKMRGAILQLADHFLRNNTTPSASDLQAYIDQSLGSGISDIFGVRIDDLGFGKSAVSVGQVQYNDLSSSQQDTFDLASAAVDQFFAEQPSQRSLKGSDIADVVDQIQAALGLKGAALVADLRKSLETTNDVEQTLQNFRTQALDLGLSSSQEKSLKSLVDQLSTADSTAMNSFDSNALVDEFSITFTSNRYGPAFSPTEIDTVAALTANTLFLNK
jgi:hypothetical protein